MRLLFVTLSILLALCAALTWSTLHWTSSDGQRVGTVQGLNHEGWLCKTWEGELPLLAPPGTAVEAFHFTVRDNELAAGLNALVGRPMVLHYQQHKGIPSSCFGETEYFVVGARPASH